MNKSKLMDFMQEHRSFFCVLTGLFDRLPFNNSWGGVKPDIGISFVKKCVIKNNGNNNRIIIGDFSKLIGCTIHIFGDDNTIYIDNQCTCNQANFWIEDSHNVIRIGERTTLCGAIQLATIEGTSIEIGRDCLFSSKIDIRTGDSHSIVKKGTNDRINKSKSIAIGNHVWLGTGVTILKGTEIADNCVVGAASLLCKKYAEENCAIAGVPGKEVRSNVDWLRERI